MKFPGPTRQSPRPGAVVVTTAVPLDSFRLAAPQRNVEGGQERVHSRFVDAGPGGLRVVDWSQHRKSCRQCLQCAFSGWVRLYPDGDAPIIDLHVLAHFSASASIDS